MSERRITQLIIERNKDTIKSINEPKEINKYVNKSYSHFEKASKTDLNYIKLFSQNNTPKTYIANENKKQFNNYNIFNKYKDEITNRDYNNCNNSLNKIKIIANYRNYKKNCFIIIFIMIFIVSNARIIYLNSSNITIKIKGKGIQSVFFGGDLCWTSKSLFNPPDEVYINDIKQINISDKYFLNESMSVVMLVWDNVISNCNCLFKECSNITDINFSHFDFSQVLYANQIFDQLHLLTSINLYDYGIIKLFDSGSMFRNCTSLTSINLSNLDVSEVGDMGGMFRGCKSLTSLDLSNFFTTNVHVIINFFMECPNLEYVNLKNAYFNKEINLENFLPEVKNIVFCTNDSLIQILVESYECGIVDCSDNWRKKQKK